MHYENKTSKILNNRDGKLRSENISYFRFRLKNSPSNENKVIQSAYRNNSDFSDKLNKNYQS